MGDQPDFAGVWLRQREGGERRIAAIERAELRQLDAAEGLRLAEMLLSATPVDSVAAARRKTSGFVEQQRLFHRASR
jgi:hypothetical protein